MIYPGARLHHYDCLIEGKVPLANLLYRTSNNYLREIIGQLLSNSSFVVEQCQNDELRMIYGSIVVQAILVYYQQIFEESSFTLQWTRNFPQLVLNYLRSNKETTFIGHLIEISSPSSSPLSTKLFNELFQQRDSTNSFAFLNCQFEIPGNQSEFNLKWFSSKHRQIHLNFNDFPSKENSLRQRFDLFSEKLNQLWHEKYPSPSQKLNISLIHDHIHLLKERLPPPLKLPRLDHLKEDCITIALYQVKIIFIFANISSSPNCSRK